MDIRLIQFKKENYRAGADGFYHKINDDLGVKVMRSDSLTRAQKEFLLNHYAATSGHTSVPIACGVVRFFRQRWIQRPAIWMKHIEGIDVLQYATNLGYKLASNISAGEALMYGYDHPSMKKYIDQMVGIFYHLQAMGFLCIDHEDVGNFIIESKTDDVYAIDFSKEITNRNLLKNIYDQFGHLLVNTHPPDLYLKENNGMLVIKQ